MKEKQDIIKRKFKKLERKSLVLNEERQYYQKRTRYYLTEARRAIGHAMLSWMEKEREQYLDWMENATWLLTEADICRQRALQEPWRVHVVQTFDS